MKLFLPLIILALASVALVWVSLRFRRKRLSAAAARALSEALQRVRALPDPVRQVLEADSVLGKALEQAGYKGTLGEMLKTAGPRFANVEDLWRMHKLRNRIAHETGTTVSDPEASAACRAVERAIASLR